MSDTFPDANLLDRSFNSSGTLDLKCNVVLTPVSCFESVAPISSMGCNVTVSERWGDLGREDASSGQRQGTRLVCDDQITGTPG